MRSSRSSSTGSCSPSSPSRRNKLPMSSESVPAAGGQDEGLDRRLLAIASVVVLGAIMSILDTTVVNVAINTLSRDFETDLATIQWIVTGYTLALATVIPITGWAADRFGTKRLYMLSKIGRAH